MTSAPRKATLLVVDDNTGPPKTFRRIGESLGFEVTVEDSREAALERIGRQRFDVALIDKKLAEVKGDRGGLFLIEELHERKEGTDAYLVTAEGKFEDAVEAWPLKVAGFIQKDDDPAITEIAVTKALKASLERDRPKRRIRGPLAFCGNDSDVVQWETNVGIHLDAKTGPLQHMLNTFGEVAAPLLERTQDDGLQKIALNAMAGLYWSRGLGDAIIVALANGELPSPLPRHHSWPAGMTILEAPIVSRSKANLHGAIFRVVGLSPNDFTVPRTPWEK